MAMPFGLSALYTVIDAEVLATRFKKLASPFSSLAVSPLSLGAPSGQSGISIRCWAGSIEVSNNKANVNSVDFIFCKKLG